MQPVTLSFQYCFFAILTAISTVLMCSSGKQLSKAKIIKFKTKSMTTHAGALRHVVTWKSSTGKLTDLKEIRTREKVKWSAAPKEFGPTKEYTVSGFHYGLGTRSAIYGNGIDNHSIIPTEFNYQLNDDGISKVWIVNQQYEMQISSENWILIPNAEYKIIRWFERNGNDLIAYAAKKGIHDRSMYIAKLSVPNWFMKKSPQMFLKNIHFNYR